MHPLLLPVAYFFAAGVFGLAIWAIWESIFFSPGRHRIANRAADDYLKNLPVYQSPRDNYKG